MVLAVADVDAAPLNEDAVRARHPAGPRIAIRTVAALACASYRGDRSRTQIDGADGVILGVDDVKRVPAERNPFGAIERRARSAELRRQGRTAVALESGDSSVPAIRRICPCEGCGSKSTLLPARRIRYIVPSGAISIERGAARRLVSIPP